MKDVDGFFSVVANIIIDNKGRMFITDKDSDQILKKIEELDKNGVEPEQPITLDNDDKIIQKISESIKYYEKY